MVPEAPTIDFPCADYPIKVIAESDPALEGAVVAIVRAHVADFRTETVTLVASRQGNYTSVRLSIVARSAEQLDTLHRALLAHPLVRLVL